MRLCRTNCAFLSNDGLCVEMMVSGRGRVALGCDEPGNSIFIREGLGKTSRAKTLATFGSVWRRLHAHPRHGAGRHTAPVNNLSLKSQHYNAKLLKGVPDGQNPLGPVNRMRYFMQCFLRAHPGSNRDDMRGCGYESARGQA